MAIPALTAYAEHPRDIEFRDQEPGERIVLLLRRHPVTYLPAIVLFVLLLVAPFFLQSVLGGTALDIFLLPLRIRLLLFLLWYLLTFAYGLLSFLSWFFNIYFVTDRRIIDLDYFGFLFFRLSEMEISQVQDVTYQVGGVWRVLFNFGDIFVQTAAELREFDFADIPEPARVHDLITDLVKEAHAR